MEKIVLGNIMIDCRDAVKMQDFYSELLGWKKCQKFGLPAVYNGGEIYFCFAKEDDYISPVWPEQSEMQQKQIHFDFQVSNVKEYVQKAIDLGGKVAPAQFGGSHFTTMLDPADHPFCLCDKKNQG